MRFSLPKLSNRARPRPLLVLLKLDHHRLV